MSNQRLPVAFQGERGAFSEQTILESLGADTETLPCPSFRSVFEAVRDGRARLGAIPVENTLGGAVHPSYDLLLEHGLPVVAETRLRVVHNLIAAPGVELEAIARVYAHPQAAAQCAGILRAHPEWTLYQVYDTAGSVKMIRDEGIVDGAAIASAAAAERFGMSVVVGSVEDDPRNLTRFVIVGPAGAEAPADADKAILAYGTRNEPGTLVRTLQVFEARGINLTRVESRPIPGRPWEYLFFVDMVGTLDDELIDALGALTTRLDVLGRFKEA